MKVSYAVHIYGTLAHGGSRRMHTHDTAALNCGVCDARVMEEQDIIL